MLGLTALAAALVVLVAGAVSGLTGFGFILVSVTPLLLIFDPVTVVTATLGLNLLTSIVVAVDARRAIRWPVVGALLPSACAGLYAGALMLRLLDASVIKLLASAIVAGFALLLLSGRSIPGTVGTSAAVVAGALSGALTTSTGLSGPPVVVLLSGRDYPPQPFRASTAAFFLPLDVLGIAMLMSQGQVHRAAVELMLLLAPVALAGTWIGRRLVRRVSVALFRRVILVLLLLTGAVGGIGAALALFPGLWH